MNTNEIVLAIDAEISRLQQAKVLMTQTYSLKPAKRKPGRPAAPSAGSKAAGINPPQSGAKTPKRRQLSAAGRASIAAAQKARWAKTKAAAK